MLSIRTSGSKLLPLAKKAGLGASVLLNYHPISLLPFIPKVLERLVNNQLTAFLENNFLDPSQIVCRASNSTESTLLTVLDIIRLE